MRCYKPKGLTIWISKPNRRGDRRYMASLRSRGRTGARGRARFLCAGKERQAYALYEWAHGRSVVL